jgi:hypothetical protein
VEPFQISPEPAEAERKAILAALAAEEAERKCTWVDALLPARPWAEEEP